MKRDNRYWQVGLTAFLTVGAILLFYDTLFGSRAAITFGGRFLDAVKPILYGAMIAYLLSPVINFIERKLFPNLLNKAEKEGKFCARGPRVVSLLLIWIVILVASYLLLSVLLPELYKSVIQLANNLETYYNTVNNWITNLLEKNPQVASWVADKIEAYYQDLLKLLSDKILPQAQQVMTAVSGGILTALAFLKNLVVGIIVSVYLMATKELSAAHGRKLICGLLPEKRAVWAFRGIRKVDDIFSGFVRGKLLDSLIIGILCFLCCSLFRFPYTPLVSVIVGVTNVIPFFGPFLGAIPSLFLILLDSPIKALYFLIFIIALQQLDGNVIGPKILGDRTGLSSLWVIIAILVGGSFFGIPGMFFGVPVCACLYSFVSFLIRGLLHKRNLPVSTDAYRKSAPLGAEKSGADGKTLR